MTLWVSLLMMPAVLYLLWRFFVSGRKLFGDTSGGRFVLPIVLCSFYLFPFIASMDFYISGGIDVLKYPKVLTYWFWGGLVFVFQLATWVLVSDGLKSLIRLFAGRKKQVEHIHSRVLLLLFVLVFCYTGWKTYRDTTHVVVEEITLPVDDLPVSLQGFTIAHISDIQGDEYTGQQDIASYIKQLNQQHPDLIIFTGDLISYGTDFIEMSARELGKAKAGYGVFAVVGDHDYWAGTAEVEKALHQNGIRLLRDENKVIPIGGGTASAVISGITQVYSKRSSAAVVDSLFQDGKKASLKIAASHQVADHLIAGAKGHDYDIMLAGHTHGGQIRVPFLGMNFSASERETKYVSGLYWEDALPVVVNNGLGFTLGPIRYDAPPTITLVRLQKK